MIRVSYERDDGPRWARFILSVDRAGVVLLRIGPRVWRVRWGRAARKVPGRPAAKRPASSSPPVSV